MPLAHILAPQLAQKARELEAELGPRPGGYLQAGNKPVPLFNPDTPEGAFAQAASSMGQAGFTGFARGAQRGMMNPQHGVAPMPPPQPPGQAPVAVDERGRPVFEDTAKPAKKDKRGRLVIDPGIGAVAVDEAGRSVDARGKKLGYLATAGARTLERRPGDVSMDQRDSFAIETLEQMYGEHLQAMEANRDDRGMPTDKFPPGYFDGMSPDVKKNIRAGVKALREIRRGPRA